MKKSCIIAITFLFITKYLASQENPDQNVSEHFVQIKLNVKAVDESGLAIPGADVHARVIYPEKYKDGSNDFKGKTDQSGDFSVESGTTSCVVPIKVSKEGYYSSCMEYLYLSELNKNTKSGERMLPWNPTVCIILKKIGKAVPMYARGAIRKTVDIPSQDMAHGYDLLLDDWIAPHGKGKVSDLKMLAHIEIIDKKNYDATLSITFPNQGDGWFVLQELKGIESELKYPREAPLEGYLSDPIVLKYRKKISYEQPVGGNPYGYIFRLRTKFDERGNVVSAIYAKIIDGKLHTRVDSRRLENPILFGASPKLMTEKGSESGCYFRMHYYLNPVANDRTLEFDRATNLAPEVDRAARYLDP